MKILPIISIVLSLLFFVPFASLIGLVLAIVALKQAKKTPKESQTLPVVAVAIGIICGILNLITTTGLLIGFFRGLAVA